MGRPMRDLRMRIAAALLCASALVMPAASGAEPRRVLHVSLYPYIPDAAAAALALKQGFERAYPDVIVDVALNAHYYSPKPEDQGVLYENADVHEIDVVFMRDFLDAHKLQPPGVALGSKLTSLARQAATYDGTLWAVPQWMCADFLIYRSDKAVLDTAHTLTGLQDAFAQDHGLLLNMKGDGQLGELYLTSLLASTGQTPEAVLSHLSATPDPVILARLQKLLTLEPAGMGRSAAYGEVESFYARQFARRAGSAFVGYSEMTHEVLDETAKSCRVEDRCVTADQIRVAALPFADGKIRPTVWVDMFAIDAKVRGKTLTDARHFIAYAVSLPAYRALLVPAADDPPRYLLPATEEAFDDRAIGQAAPLYAKFRAIVNQGVVVTVPHLNATLHDVAASIDASLPQSH